MDSFFVAYYGTYLSVNLIRCHFVDNSQCPFYKLEGEGRLTFNVESANFDIKESEVDKANFNIDTSCVIFGDNSTFSMPNIKNMCNMFGDESYSACAQVIFGRRSLLHFNLLVFYK